MPWAISRVMALTGKTAYRGEDIVLAKPQSYMNTSGGPVKQLAAGVLCGIARCTRA